MDKKQKRNIVDFAKLDVLVAVITLIIALLSTCATLLNTLKINSNKEPDISTRIETITESLSQDANELKKIETELKNRIAYVEDLKAEAEAAESILNVSETQINAIHSMLSEELEANNKKNFLPTVFNNLFFCILGMITPPLVKGIIKKVKG